LLVFKQPNANVISTADGVKAQLPSLRADFPPDISLSVVSDRTLTIRASVAHVEFTLMLAVALVVMVIFLFLRNVWAAIIPSITIPVALVAALGMMYVCGFSLDNLSLMGLTIAVEFVVDDAIVMLENIFRHIEEGGDPVNAGLVGAGEIGFTILSVSFPLIAVFIPLLLMGGIVGRLFREFAICASITIVISAMVSLTLTPMMCSRFLSPRRTNTRASTTRWSGCLMGCSDSTSGHSTSRCASAHGFRRLGDADRRAVCFIPNGFFPTQDTGIIIVITDTAQDSSFDQMSVLQRAANSVVMDNAVVPVVWTVSGKS
jgi:multidrug efflux pump subunit AcrB